MTTTVTKPKKPQTFTLEEIDEQLNTLRNIRKHSIHANKKTLNRRIDIWLDRRLFLTRHVVEEGREVIDG